jgi:uncharacterized membrane protein
VPSLLATVAGQSLLQCRASGALARPNPVLLAVLGMVGFLLTLVLAEPPVAALFRLEGFVAWQARPALAISMAVLLVLEAAKRLPGL